MGSVRITYNDRVVRRFLIASLVWGIAAMLVGALIALQLVWWPSNVSPEISFGRLRPVHTNALLYAFIGNMVFAGILYSSQRLLKARLPSTFAASFHFWGWQLVVLAGLVTIPLGFTQGKEYAELEWPFDVAIAVLWLVFAANFFAMVAKRRERRLYVAVWFYIATIVAFGLLHIVGNLAVPTGALESVSVFGGAADAMLQWWYGHNAISFFMTMPVLGIMYYAVPKAAGRPLHSYPLAVIHFWALVFLYVWAGPHHLLNTALPDWAQSLGVIFSLLLWAPNWGGAVNGLLTLRGTFDRLRTDPVLKFFAAAILFYALVSFEGPMLSLRSVSGLVHFTDWIVGHAHASGLGWNGLMAAGLLYWLVPKLWNTKLRSVRAANLHFLLACGGLFVYVASMWISGATQGAMWQAENPEGGLAYPSFIQTMAGLGVMYWTRLVGGLVYLAGFVLMAWNLWATTRTGNAEDETVEVEEPTPEPRTGIFALLTSMPVVASAAVLALIVFAGTVNAGGALALLMVASVVAVFSVAASGIGGGSSSWHRALEKRGSAFAVVVLIAVLVGSAVELVPSLTRDQGQGEQAPYTALELAGRAVYIDEGCHNCHSQMVRPFMWETARYPSAPTLAGESRYDHPFQWGSRRIGPDLARLGGKYPHTWHYDHMRDPRLTSPGSNMPAYPHLESERVDEGKLAAKIAALETLGVPISDRAYAIQEAVLRAELAAELEGTGTEPPGAKTKIVALIAYLQRLGVPPRDE